MKPRLLLLEDEPASRLFLAAAAAELAIEVDVAGSVAEGMALAVDGGHDLWLFDANLPDGTGSQLLARLRRRGLRTPAVAHTATPEAHEHRQLLADGFASVVVKPLPAPAWQEAIRRALQGQSTPACDAAAARADAVGDLPVWDDAAAAASLGGNTANVAALRQLFLAELPAARDQVLAAAGRHDTATLQATLHKLHAGCGFVGAARLAAAGRALHRTPGSNERLRAFSAAVDATLA